VVRSAGTRIVGTVVRPVRRGPRPQRVEVGTGHACLRGARKGSQGGDGRDIGRSRRL
jgi:hypothetical protein